MGQRTTWKYQLMLVAQIESKIGVKSACEALAVQRSRVYRERQGQALLEQKVQISPEPALYSEERVEVRETLNSKRFMDKAPRQVYATLLDEGAYLCHWRTMYRILAAHDEVRERRNIRRHPAYKKREMLANYG